MGEACTELGRSGQRERSNNFPLRPLGLLNMNDFMFKRGTLRGRGFFRGRNIIKEDRWKRKQEKVLKLKRRNLT
jgi:hypothetical protein